MLKTITINDPLDFIRVILEAQSHLGTGDIWWRGHYKSEPEWKLIPNVYRQNRNRTFELAIVRRFCRQAPGRYPNWPKTDHERLFLMQHYGLPTRLLDWSASPLVALIFVTQDDNDKSNKYTDPSILWALNVQSLNKHQYGRAVLPNSQNIHPLFHAAYTDVKEDTNKIIGILPGYIDIRMVVQQSCFTIHGMSRPLEDLENSENFLVRIVIPPNIRQKLMDLFYKHLMFRQSDLFPDLDHLAKDLISYNYIDMETE